MVPKVSTPVLARIKPRPSSSQLRALPLESPTLWFYIIVIPRTYIYCNERGHGKFNRGTSVFDYTQFNLVIPNFWPCHYFVYIVYPRQITLVEDMMQYSIFVH